VSSYLYTVDVDLSSAAINVDVDPLDIGDVRDVKTSTVDLSISSSSADINVSSNRGWLTSQDREALSLPTGSERFIFDVSNPSCYPGSGNTLFDLSSNGYDCVHRQLDILYSDPAADNSNFSNCAYQVGGPASDSGTIIDFDVESNNTGTFVKINPNIETENAKYLSWDAPGNDSGTYTTFMVFENRDIDDYLSSTVLDYDNEVDDPDDPTILGASRRIGLNTRSGQGGIALRGHYLFSVAYDLRPFEGIPTVLFSRSVVLGFAKFSGQDYSVRSRQISFLEDSSYNQALLDYYPPPGGFNLTANGELQFGEYTPYIPGNRFHYHPLTEQSPNVLSVTVDGPKARVYADGEFVVEMDIVDSILNSTSPRWVTGISMNADETLRVCGAGSANIYAWGMYDRALTTEEHLDIHKKYRIAPRPSKAVDVANLPDLVSFNVNEPSGRADANVDIDLSSSVTSVSFDIPFSASNAVDLSIDPLFHGLLEIRDQAEVAYSLRKLSFLHAGAAIRVRRESDDKEIDIGFANNELDVTSLASFCEGTNGFVTTWYDQSGNFNNATQTNALLQARICNSGTGVTTDNKGNPTVIFNLTQSNQSYSFDSEVVLRNANPDRFLISFVADVSDEDSDVGYFTSPNNNAGEYFGGISFQSFNFFSYEGNSSRYRFRHTNETSTAPDENVNTNYALPDPFFTHDTIASFALYVDSEVKKLNVNGQNLSSSGSSGWVSGGERKSNIGRIGRAYSTDLNAGMYSEFIIWRNYSDGDLERVQGNVNDHYSIY